MIGLICIDNSRGVKIILDYDGLDKIMNFITTDWELCISDILNTKEALEGNEIFSNEEK